MKNVERIMTKSFMNASSALMLALFMLVNFTAKADIIGVSATVEGGYLPGGSSTIIVDVTFDSNTAEDADFIEFRTSGPIAGLSLSHGFPSPSPYQGCGSNTGAEMTSDGPGWGTPMMMTGNSGCGAFEAGTTHRFGVTIDSDGQFTGALGIEVRVVGDGQGELVASEAVLEVSVAPIVCTIVCPNVPPVPVPANSCGTNFNVPPPTLTGDCGTTPAPVTQFFPVGENIVTYNAVDANGNSISCTTIVTVFDDEDPLVVGVQDLEYDLLPGECGYVIPQTFSVNDNCIDPPLTASQNLDISTFESGFNCPGGPTSYIRLFDADNVGINTEYTIDEVTFGVLEAFGNPSVTVNVYRVVGPPVFANMELIGTGTDILPNFENALYSIPVSATVGVGETFALEVVVPGSQFNGVIMAMNAGGETAPTYVASSFCGIQEPVTAASQGFEDIGVILFADGTQSSYIVQPVGDSPTVGDTVYEGATTVELEAIDASGNTTAIVFVVTVNGFDDPISAIACNDEVYISLDEDCETVVTADQILEGGPYACFDEYIVEIFNEQTEYNYGNTIGADNIGEDLYVKITGPNGNSCWGNIVVEDKAAPNLECLEVYTTCTGEVFPGSPISEVVTFNANVTSSNETIDSVGISNNFYTVPVFGLVNSTITKVAVRLNIAHDAVSDLTATITSPDGTSATLFTEPGTDCDSSNIMITLDDMAFNTYADLQDTCGTEDPSISGMYQPQQLLNIFNGQDPNGDWLLTISDINDGNGGTVLNAELIITQAGGVVTFPTENDVVFQTEGNNIYSVIGIDGCGTATLSYNDFDLQVDCSSPYSRVIQRTWNGEDESGNQSVACIQTIYVYRNGLSTLMFPPNYDGIQEQELSCADFGDEVPGTDVTGAPSGDLCDNVQIFPYTDTRVDICDGSYKLVRHFRLLEWCSGEVVEHNQIIKVTDTEGPELEVLEDITISAGEFDCEADYVAPAPQVLFDCSDEFEYEFRYLPAFNEGNPPEDEIYYDEDVTITGSGDAVITGLPFGRVWAKWTVHDECGNSSDLFYTIEVEDQVNPIAVCDEFTVVSVGAEGDVEVFASTFDDGSLDNCGIQSIQARKMTSQCPGGTSFGESVWFCCNEVGETIMVEFEVTDFNNNKNTCMVEVTVQDKLPPYITQCPPDITLDCQADYTDLEVTGEPEYIDNCEVISVEFVDNGGLNNCGEGVISRTWTVEDKEGFKASCVQRITLEDSDPFVEGDIDWPNDYDATTCNTDLSPDNLPVANAYPRYDDDNCSLVAAQYDDTHFSFVDGACEKILREWTVIDWCTYDENNPVLGEGWYTHLQVIKLTNNIEPEIEGCMDSTVDVFGDCEGEVNFEISATDDCTPEEEINFTYEIDLFDDGIDGLDFGLSGNSKSFTRTLPVGEHKVSWTAEDQCGNTEFCTMILTVRDGKKPTPYCLSTITTVVMNNNGMIDIWASDFDFGSTDNCTAQEDLLISFSGNVNDTQRIFDCDDLPNGEEEEIQLEIWVTDEAGNQEFCSIAVILQDSNADVCQGDTTGNKITVGGMVRTENLESIQNVNVNVRATVLEVNEYDLTDATGEFRINDLPRGASYNLRAAKNDDLRNGVTTLDLVQIQRHLLGLEEFTSPYKVIASDITNDGQIKANDLSALRKVILGVTNSFPNNQESWRFTPAGSTMDVADPFPFLEVEELGQMNHSSYNNNIIGIKIGDVNGSVVANAQAANQSTTRNNRTLVIAVDNKSIAENDIIEVPVFATDDLELMGYQFTMNLNGLSLTDVISGQLDVTQDNYGVFDDAITTSWADPYGKEVNSDDPLFTMVFEASRGNSVAQAIQISSEVVTAEAYDLDGQTLDVELEVRSGNILNTFEVYQNKPNPFRENTQIEFDLPKAMDVNIMITDITGQKILNRTQFFNAGKQVIMINKDELGVTGLMYYTITAGEHVASRKMISVR